MSKGWNKYWKKESQFIYWHELLQRIDRTRVKKVLDLGCGIGRHAVLFTKEGFSVTAVDFSKKALVFLRSKAAEEKLKIKIIEGNYNHDLFRPGSFDFILAFDVLYHGYRNDFENAIGLVHKWLKPGGLFFFTCPTRRDGKFSSGEEAAPNTFKPTNSINPGELHYFSDEADISEFLKDFTAIQKNVDEHYWDNEGVRQFSSYWQILAKKPVTKKG
jgi:SAM-dependent methyltransferase